MSVKLHVMSGLALRARHEEERMDQTAASTIARLNRHLASLVQRRRVCRTWRTNSNKATCVAQQHKLRALWNVRGDSKLGRQRPVRIVPSLKEAV